MLPLWDEKNCSKRRNGKTDLGDGTLIQRRHYTGVPHVGAAVDFSVGVEYFPPFAGERHADAVVAIDLGRGIHHHNAAVPGVLALAQPGKDAAVGVMHHQPLKAGVIAIERMQRRHAAIEPVEIADEALNAGMPRLFEKMPVERMIVAPVAFLTELAAHKHQLLVEMPEHTNAIAAQVCT